MAVPKTKISKSKRGMRRGSNGSYKLNLPNVVADATTGEYKLSHHISVDGYYNGRKVVDLEKKVAEEEEV
ncbi:MAG: large subunit ribosomal protein L32 [Lentimonas sp.]|jgi:large subunit ribosomal protein L32